MSTLMMMGYEYGSKPVSGGGGGGASFSPVFAFAANNAFSSPELDSPTETWPAGTATIAVYDELANTDLVVTINGVGATQIGTYNAGGRGSVWRANVSASSGIAKVVTPGGTFGCVATIGGVVTTSTPTPSGTPQILDMAGTAQPQAVVTQTIPTSGVGVFFAAGTNSGGVAGTPTTWTTGATDEEFTVTTGNGVNITMTHVTTPGSVTPGASSLGNGGNGFGYTGANGFEAGVTWGP